VWLVLVLAFATALDAAAQPSAAEALRQIEFRGARNPARAARELADWLVKAPVLNEQDKLRVDLIRVELAGAMDSSASAPAQVDLLLPRLVDAGDAALHARALALRARLLDFLNRGTEALADSMVAFDHAGAAGAQELQVEILVHRAGMLSNRADFAAAYAALTQAQRLAHDVGSHRAEGSVAYYAGWLASAVGDRRR
jgi:hypothetical protein